MGGTPKNIFFLTCDAFGVLPPIAKLTPQQAMFQFISGYTAKVAGTEVGIKEPKMVFSTCFGAPFMPLHPSKYAGLLGQKMKENSVNVWLINTGWSGGPYGVGSRMKLGYTRSMIHSALNGSLLKQTFEQDAIFGLWMPKECEGVPSEILNPRNTWTDKAAYDEKAMWLAHALMDNFKKFSTGTSDDIHAGAPLALLEELHH
jgi:phosphoenolpyruvate carboxykinase (ATP)